MGAKSLDIPKATAMSPLSTPGPSGFPFLGSCLNERALKKTQSDQDYKGAKWQFDLESCIFLQGFKTKCCILVYVCQIIFFVMISLW